MENRNIEKSYVMMADGRWQYRVAPSYDVIKSLKSGDQLPKPGDISHLNLR